MRVCGIKLTHDGGVSLIDDGKLIFSIEMEKLNNAPRHSKLSDIATAFDLLSDHGCPVHELDDLVFDGWRRTEKVRQLFGQDVLVRIAPYRRGLVSTDPLERYEGTLWDVRYSSYYHYSTHAVGSYCASPFAAEGQSSWVLVWDGAMFPFLYHVGNDSVSIKSVGPILPLLGNAYHELALRIPPFNTGLTFPATLSVPGKQMALIARGQVVEDLMAQYEVAFAHGISLLDHARRADDGYYQEPLGHQILNSIIGAIDTRRFDPVDALATWHQFLEDKLIAGLKEAIERSEHASDNLVFCGGCALNIKWNSSLRASGMFSHVWVPPFPNDSGSALGAAACGLASKQGLRPIEWSVYAGPSLKSRGALPGWERTSGSTREVASLLVETGEPIVFLHGRAEIGPRALGHRSILAPATSHVMKGHLNSIKRREDYRPIAPICLEEHAHHIFDLDGPDPYMVFECRVRKDWIARIPAVVHEDGTARVQTVSAKSDEPVRRVLEEYYRITGIPLLCNTSANEHGAGFFADDVSAMAWGKTNYVWAEGNLYSRQVPLRNPALRNEATRIPSFLED